jgi:hypothetical protein
MHFFTPEAAPLGTAQETHKYGRGGAGQEEPRRKQSSKMRERPKGLISEDVGGLMEFGMTHQSPSPSEGSCERT